jgi:hypothetical protein
LVANLANAPTPGEMLNGPLPNVEVVAEEAVGCAAGAGAPNMPVVPNPAFCCASFVPSPRDIAENVKSWLVSVDMDSVDSAG